MSNMYFSELKPRTTVAALSFVAYACGAQFAAANTAEMTEMAAATPVVAEEAVATATPAVTPEAAPEDGKTRLAITADEDGLFAMTVPLGLDIKVLIDGQVVFDTTQIEAVGDEDLKTLFSLSKGVHVLELEFADGDLSDEFLQEIMEQVMVGALGQDPIAVAMLPAFTGEMPLALDALSAEEGTDLASDGELKVPVIGGTFSPESGAGFSIGSTARTNPAQAPANGSGSGGAGGMAGGMMMGGGNFQPNQGSGGSMSSGSGGGTTVASAVPLSVPSSGGSSGGGMSSGGSGGTPTATPTATPAPAPAPAPAPVVPPPSVNPIPPTVVPGATVSPSVGSSPLNPPANPVLTQAVQLTSAGTTEGIVSTAGQTVFGAVQDPNSFDVVNVTIAPTGRTTRVDVGRTTGQFAVRLQPEDFSAGNAIQVTLVAEDTTSDAVTSAPVTYDLTGQVPVDGVAQALSRLTFGPSPATYATVQSMGFSTWLEQQLQPDTIDDSAFLSSNPDGLYPAFGSNQNDLWRGIWAREIAHAAYSQRQLKEVMASFWANHFFAATKGTSVRRQNSIDRAFFRENAFGRFEDLFSYSARSPLMSQFLDNDQNRRGNLNENYAREVLELHTVGVDGGYGDLDVIEVARIFTGWTFRQTNEGADDTDRLYEFEFRADRHDEDDKFVPFLNLAITGQSGPAGEQEGQQLITALSNDPRTRNYVCGKLVQALVADNPPASYVTSCVAAWVASDGSTEAMLRAILTDPTYITTVQFQRNKVKSPFEFAVSVIRAFGAQPLPGETLSFYNTFKGTVESAGQPLFAFPVPTGFPEVGSAWVSTASLLARFRGVMDVAENPEEHSIDTSLFITGPGLETAEEVAAYMLAISTADRYAADEFEQVVDVLKGVDGIFDPMDPATNMETVAIRKAIGLIVTLPSFQMQ